MCIHHYLTMCYQYSESCACTQENVPITHQRRLQTVAHSGDWTTNSISVEWAYTAELREAQVGDGEKMDHLCVPSVPYGGDGSHSS